LPISPDGARRWPRNFSISSASALTADGHGARTSPIRYVPRFGPERWARHARWRFQRGERDTLFSRRTLARIFAPQ
jgi:hypothetical protein